MQHIVNPHSSGGVTNIWKEDKFSDVVHLHAHN